MGAAAPAAARVEYPPGEFSISLSVGVVLPGATVNVTVTGCVSGEGIALTVSDTPTDMEATCVGPAGAFGSTRMLPQAVSTASLTLTAPDSVGTYTVRAAELSGELRSATAVLAVQLPGVTTTTTGEGGSLPATGTDIGRILAVASVAVGSGFSIVVLWRRRRLPSH